MHRNSSNPEFRLEDAKKREEKTFGTFSITPQDNASGRTISRIKQHGTHRLTIRQNREINGIQEVLFEDHTCQTRFWLPQDEWKRNSTGN